MHVPLPKDFCPVSLAHLHSILEMIFIVGIKCLERKAHGNEQVPYASFKTYLDDI